MNDFNSAVIYYNKAFAKKGGEGIYTDYTANNVVDVDKFDVPGHQLATKEPSHFMNQIAYNAFADFQHFFNKGFMTADCYQRVGSIYIARGQKEKACKYFQKAIDLGNKEEESDTPNYCKN